MVNISPVIGGSIGGILIVKLFESIFVKDSLILNPSFVVNVTILLSPLEILIFKPSVKFWSVALWTSNNFLINNNDALVILWLTLLKCETSVSSIIPTFILVDNCKLVIAPSSLELQDIIASGVASATPKPKPNKSLFFLTMIYHL